MIRSFLPRAVRLAIAGIAAVSACHTAAADTQTDRDQQIRTAMVFNFARFAEWADHTADTSITLCMSRDADIGESLKALDGRLVGARPLSTRWLDESRPGECDMAYLSAGDANSRAARLLSEGVLTISTVSSFSDQGVIGIVRIGRQTRFEVNQTAASGAGITLSSKLLRVAAEVK